VRHAQGRVTLFVQTRADVDADIRDDWCKFLESLGFQVPRIFLLDARVASDRQARHEEPPAEFLEFRAHLGDRLARRARYRIKRANLLGAFGWLLRITRQGCEEGLQAVKQLEQAIKQAHEELVVGIRKRLTSQLRANRRLWRTRLLRQLVGAWAGGPFAGLLHLLEGGASFVRAIVLTRARTPIQLLLAGGLVAGQAVHARRRERRVVDAWVSGADLGISEAVIIRHRSVLQAYVTGAQLGDVAKAFPHDGPSSEELVAVARRLYQQIEAAITRQIEDRVARRAGHALHVAMELLFSGLPVYVLVQLGINFFYDYPYRGRPLLGLDFMLQAAFWVILWGMFLRGVLMGLLGRGLEKEAATLVESVSSSTILGPLYGELTEACRAVGLHAETLRTLETELARLREQFGRVEEVAVGTWDGPYDLASVDTAESAESTKGLLDGTRYPSKIST
jgi:hypothetical protein